VRAARAAHGGNSLRPLVGGTKCKQDVCCKKTDRKLTAIRVQSISTHYENNMCAWCNLLIASEKQFDCKNTQAIKLQT
jgi:hypothetical protein